MIDWGEIFEYDGINLLWKIKPCNSVNIGDVAGYYDNGYNWVVIKARNMGYIELYGKCTTARSRKVIK